MNAAQVLTPLPRLVEGDPSDREHYEIVDGVRKELPPMSADSQVLATRLSRHLSNFGVTQNIGEAYVETLFKLPLTRERNRKPDVAFVPYSRWPLARDVPSVNAWDVLPDLCVEVVSPNDMADDLMDKVCEYFEAGVRLVWVFFPRHGLVQVFESPANVRGLSWSDTLDGGAVLPGFRLALTDVLRAPRPPAPPTGP